MSHSPAQISVVIPVHNGARYLGEALASVWGQTLKPAQVIVVDDGSTDESGAVARGYTGVEYHFQENAGAAVARNAGVKLARHEYLAFLDADDLWMPQKLEWQWAALTGSASCDMVFGHVEQFASPDLPPADLARIHIPHPRMAAFSPGSLLMRRTDFYRAGEFESQWGVGEFIDWYLKAIDIGLQSQVLPDVVLRRRIHLANMGRLKQDSRSDYVRIAKATLDRRRKMSQEP